MFAEIASVTMPLAPTYPRCAPWTRAQGVDPIGSALTCDTLVLIEVPPPWPRDVGEIPVFADLQRRGLRRTRLLAVRPLADDPGDPVGEVAVAGGSAVAGGAAVAGAPRSPAIGRDRTPEQACA